MSVRAAQIHERFESVTPLTVGLEEEAMLLDADTFDLVPFAQPVLDRVAGDERFKCELPAAQVELVTAPCADVPSAIALLARGRRDLAVAAEGIALPAVAGVHPFASVEGTLNSGASYDHAVAEYGPVARRQLVAALQVHVAVGGADRSIAVHDAVRCFLPELAALAANAPFYDGRDSELASVRPLLCQQLPRQGIPPAIGSWAALVDELSWGHRAGAVPEPGVWWWELRPHLSHGTLELRVPDAQTTVREAAAIAATIHALVAWLSGRYDAGDTLPSAPTWRIAENRWSALRHGIDGAMADLQTGERQPTRTRLRSLLHTLAPTFEQVGAGALWADASALTECNGAIRQRAFVAGGNDLRELAGWLARSYLDPDGGDVPGALQGASLGRVAERPPT